MTEARQRVRTTPVAVPPPEPVIEAEAPDVDVGEFDITEEVELDHSNIEAVMSQVSARMGPNVMRKATAVPGFNQIETGIFTLDMALLGGIPEGLSTMLYGWESSGKTTLAKRVAGRMQAKYPDKAVLFVDLESTYDRQWGAKHGIDNDRLYIAQPESGEQAVDIVDAMLQTPETCMVIIDSLPALTPMKEVEASAEDDLVAVRARLIAKLCSKILRNTIKARNAGHPVTVLMINQFRTKIGARMPTNVLPGGNQPKFLCTTMIEMRNREMMKKGLRGIEIVSHNEHGFRIKKSRVGNSIREGEFIMIRDPEHPLGEGTIDEAEVVVNYAKRFGLLTGGGSSWRIDGLDRKFGKAAEIADFLENDPNEYLDLKRRIIMMNRIDMGLLPLPPDQYLLGWVET